MDKVKIVVFVPESHADIVRQAMGDAEAGTIGNYNFCSFSSKGVGRFIPTEKAHPTIGSLEKFEEVIEERIESICDKANVDKVIAAIKKVHPYEEPAIDIYPLLSII